MVNRIFVDYQDACFIARQYLCGEDVYRYLHPLPILNHEFSRNREGVVDLEKDANIEH